MSAANRDGEPGGDDYLLPGGKRPNVIWVFGDQHRAQAMGCAGDPNLNTPNLDRLAAEGVWFRHAMMGFPLCCPARGSLLTGRYPHNCVPAHQAPMPPDSTTIAHAFHDAGYRTAWIGKWHLDGVNAAEQPPAHAIVPPERRGGFDTWIGYENNNAQFDCYVHGHDGDREIDKYKLPAFETDALTDIFTEWIERNHDQPFFAALSVQPPHDPYTAPPEWMARHNPANLQLRPNVPDIPSITDPARRELAGYYALIENLDNNLGRIREKLQALGLTDETFIVFFSDHGDQHGSHGHFRKMTPYEESIRVPFIIGGPCRFHYQLRHENNAPVNHVDVAPTTLGLAGIDAPPTMAGFDYAGALRPDRRRTDAPTSAFLQSVVPTGHPPSIDRPWRGVVTHDRWKYVALEHQPYLMFNLNEDPYELVNLAHHAHAARKRRELNELTRQWVETTGDAFNLPDL